MYQLEVLSKIPEPEHDDIIRIRQGESVLLEIDKNHSVSSVHFSGRTVEQMKKTIPALIIAISDDLHEIFRVFTAPKDPEDTIPFLAISSDRNELLRCRAEGKIHFSITADCPGESWGPMQYLNEIIGKTEYCFILCSQKNLEFIHLAGEIAQYGREQNTLMALAVIGKGHQNSFEKVSDILEKFHTIVLPLDKTNSEVPVPLEQIRDLCEATIDDIVATGGRTSVEGTDRSIVQELMFSGGVSYLGLHIAGGPDACELTKGFVQSVGGKGQIRTSGTYAILKVPFESTTDVAYHLRGSLSNILSENIPSRFPHQGRLEAYNPKVQGQYDLTIWTMTGKYKLL